MLEAANDQEPAENEKSIDRSITDRPIVDFQNRSSRNASRYGEDMFQHDRGS